MNTRITFLLLLIFSSAVVAAGDPAAGKQKAAVCGACHGPSGVSPNPIWPSLAGQHANYTISQLEAFRSGERVNEQMAPMVAALSDEDIADLAAYYASQPAPLGTADPAQVRVGQQIYRGGNLDSGVPACMACHGPSGSGNPAAAYPLLKGQHAEYTAAQLRAYAASERRSAKANIMLPIARAMTEQEITAVASYVAGLH
jgi:cytochrome c553